MIVIQCALLCEARPFISHFKLKKKIHVNTFPLYTNDEEVFLILSGVGKLHAASSLSYFFGKYSANSPLCLNVGICGHKSQEIGKSFLISKVFDKSSEKSYFPLFPFKTSFPKYALTTVDTPEKKFEDDVLYDMESSGFCLAAQRFTTAELVHLIKIISDNLSTPFHNLNEKTVETLIEKNLHPIITYIEKFHALIACLRNELSSESFALITEHCHFTVSQELMLKKLLSSLQAFSQKPFMPELSSFSKADEVLDYLAKKLHAVPLQIENSSEKDYV